MNGVVGELKEIKFPLKLEANPIKQRPYRLNLKYNEKVKEEIDKIL